MINSKRFLVPMYLGAAVLVLLPMLELVQAVWPVRPGDSAWRVITVGLVSRVLVTPLLALMVVHALLMVQESRAWFRTFAILNSVLVLVMLATLAMFMLDALEVRTNIAAQARETYEIGVLLSFVKLGTGMLLLVALAVAQWKAASGLKRSSAHAAPVLRSPLARPQERSEVAAGAVREAPEA